MKANAQTSLLLCFRGRELKVALGDGKELCNDAYICEKFSHLSKRYAVFFDVASQLLGLCEPFRTNSAIRYSCCVLEELVNFLLLCLSFQHCGAFDDPKQANPGVIC